MIFRAFKLSTLLTDILALIMLGLYCDNSYSIGLNFLNR